MVEYLLQNCSGGYVGNSPVFWRKGGSGYTPWIDEAQRWSKEAAEFQIRSTRGSHTWKMWSVVEIESVAKRTVDIQDLRKLVSKEDEERCAVVIADGEVVGATKASDSDESSDMEEDEQQE